MTGNELIAEVLDRLPQPYSEMFTHTSMKLILRTICAVVVEATSVGENVKIRNFGTFSTFSRKGTKVFCGLGVNKYVEGRQHIRVKFRPSPKWRKALNEVSGRNR